MNYFTLCSLSANSPSSFSDNDLASYLNKILRGECPQTTYLLTCADSHCFLVSCYIQSTSTICILPNIYVGAWLMVNMHHSYICIRIYFFFFLVSHLIASFISHIWLFKIFSSSQAQWHTPVIPAT